MSVMMDLLAVARATAGALVGDNASFRGVSTDSRTIAAGELFIALRGENFDGHDYVAAAQARGAVGAVVAADAADVLQALGLPLVLVAETRLSLGALAADWRGRFQLPLIAVTGSNGKTTTKEMIASILRVVYGGIEVGAQLCAHPEVDSIHVTGSDRTYDAIVWGGDPDQRAFQAEMPG